MSLPPGAMTVVPSLHEFVVLNAKVPTFNASDFGDMIITSIRPNTLFQFRESMFQPEQVQELSLDYSLDPAIHGMIHQTLLARRVEDAPSTCSANCSYDLSFTGPYVQCTETSNASTILYYGHDSLNFMNFPMFNSSTEQWSVNYEFFDDPDIKDPPSHSRIEMSISSARSIGFKKEYSEQFEAPAGMITHTEGQWKIDTINHYWTCTPSRAGYTVHTTYKDNVRSLEVSIDKTSIKPLMPAPPSSIGVARNQTGYFVSPLDPAVAPILRDANLYSIITPVMKTISGTYNGTCAVTNREFDYNSTHTDSDGFEYYNFTNTFPPTTWSIELNPNDTISNDFMAVLPIAQYFSGTSVLPSFSNISVNNGGVFTINETSINAMLQDVVLSMISYQAKNWTARVDQTRNELRTIYTISRPFNLFLPYGLMLLGSLCAISLGFYALRSNGVPATDGGFLQLFTTAQRSDTVDRIARGGCLGGEENVPTALKDLKIQFGELIEAEEDSEGAVLSTAGFGTENEIRPLKRERIYGTM